MIFHRYRMDGHGLDGPYVIEAPSRKAAIQQLDYFDRGHYIIDPDEMDAALASQDGAKFLERIKAELAKWPGWSRFFREEGVPGCRVPKATSIGDAALIIAREAYIRGYPMSESTARSQIDELIEGEGAYSPDF